MPPISPVAAKPAVDLDTANKIRSERGFAPLKQLGAPAAPAGNDAWTRIQAKAQSKVQAKDVAAKDAHSKLNLGELDAEQVEQGTAHASEAIQRGAKKLAETPDIEPGMGIVPAVKATAKKTGVLLEAGLGAAAGGAQAVAAPLTAVSEKLFSKLGLSSDQILGPNGKKIAAKIDEWAQAHPDAARNLADAVTVAGTAIADVGAKNPLNTDVGQAGKDVVQAVKEAPATAHAIDSKITDAVKSVTKKAPSAAAVQQEVGNHMATARQIADNLPDVKTNELVADTHKNIVDGLKSEGMTKESAAVAKLNPEDYKTLASYESAVKNATTPEHIRELATPVQTTGKTGTLTANIKAGRVDEGGLVTGRTVNPDAHQIAIEQELKTVPGIEKGSTNLQAANAVHDEIGATAQKLESDLATREVQPTLTQEHWDGYLNGVKEDIAKNPLLVGDAEKTADKILNKFTSLLPKEGDITASDILTARKGLDSWIKDITRGNAFDPKTENAVSIALRATRQGANDLMEVTAPDVAVKDMLRRQSLLYDALENIAPKAAKESGSAVGRAIQAVKDHPVLSTGLGIVGADVLLHKIGI